MQQVELQNAGIFNDIGNAMQGAGKVAKDIFSFIPFQQQ